MVGAVARSFEDRIFHSVISAVWETKEEQHHDHKEPNWKELRRQLRARRMRPAYTKRKIFPPRWTKYRRQLRW